MSNYPLVLKKVSGIDTAAHEAMHVATLIYYIIKYYDENRLELLNDIFNWSLRVATIIENEAENSKGCFYHRAWGRYTEKADVYCSFSGFIGGYIFFGVDNESNTEWKRRLDTLNWLLYSKYVNKEELEERYRLWGASSDLELTKVTDYEEQLKYVREITKLLKRSTLFQDMFLDCLKRLQDKHTLYTEELVELANRYRDKIIAEAYTSKVYCISISGKQPKYHYYTI